MEPDDLTRGFLRLKHGHELPRGEAEALDGWCTHVARSADRRNGGLLDVSPGEVYHQLVKTVPAASGLRLAERKIRDNLREERRKLQNRLRLDTRHVRELGDYSVPVADAAVGNVMAASQLLTARSVLGPDLYVAVSGAVGNDEGAVRGAARRTGLSPGTVSNRLRPLREE